MFFVNTQVLKLICYDDGSPFFDSFLSQHKILINVALKGCDRAGLRIPNTTSATTVVATRCEFANNTYGARITGSLTSATFKNCVFLRFPVYQLTPSAPRILKEIVRVVVCKREPKKNVRKVLVATRST